VIGQITLLLGTPGVAIAAIAALRGSPDRAWALGAAALAVLELIFLLAILMIPGAA
jgi:hypothetical protein